MTPRDVLKVYPSQMAAAKAIGVSKQAVSKWKQKKSIPLKWQLKYQFVTDGVLKADLPDFVFVNRAVSNRTLP